MNDNYFQALLTEDSIERIASAIRARFENKVFAIASCEYADSENAEPRLILSAKFNSEWTTPPRDKENEMVRVFKKGVDKNFEGEVENKSWLAFSAGGYFWSWHVRDGKFDDYFTPVFCFEHNKMTIINRAPAGKGCLHKHLFQVHEKYEE